MSGAERHVVTGTTPPKHEGGEREYFMAVVVLASDYDRDTQALQERADAEQEAHDGQRRILDAVKAERDALRAQVEAMRELLRKVAPHFAAPPGLGYLHVEIDAALQEDKPC